MARQSLYDSSNASNPSIHVHSSSVDSNVGADEGDMGSGGLKIGRIPELRPHGTEPMAIPNGHEHGHHHDHHDHHGHDHNHSYSHGNGNGHTHGSFASAVSTISPPKLSLSYSPSRPTSTPKKNFAFAIPAPRSRSPSPTRHVSIPAPPRSPSPKRISIHPVKAPFSFPSVPSSPPMKRPPAWGGGNGTGTKPVSRRGHHHQRSLSHNIFLPPKERAPLALPASYTVPTMREVLSSLTSAQKSRFVVALAHVAAAALCWHTSPSHSSTSLSYVTLFDALGSLTCSLSSSLQNFEVWDKPSVRRPFGLRQGEVLAGFFGAVFLLYGALGVILKETLEDVVVGWGVGAGVVGGHGHHGGAHGGDGHGHGHGEGGGVEWGLVGVVVMSGICGMLFEGHGKYAKFFLGDMGARMNPFKLITPLIAVVLIFMHGMGEVSVLADRVVAFAMAGVTTWLGFTYARTTGKMLLMTAPGREIESVQKDIADIPGVRRVDKLTVWQPHDAICVANVIVKVDPLDIMGDKADRALREGIEERIKEKFEGAKGCVEVNRSEED
ncbi:hypothetical protein SAICODRAFT_208954 [Saitoella complicata NRRL Y-17804]|uniref:uncharacterized protein n=1 Tax=Saitoella complicata (strain BCRC 22490 / CBS 7301 / JCM 7358 / NBRC 10748 / NRRL Y-17804) TaxID=698492 RepID=UPI000867C9AD|nr:uncharacterized protein SAICODRAFT_208954 [Saitoella complicata NRRL Y-17804]ODQ54370.1 hypothetical protein SAICODRAFT_208954 [Saitoella complicata NRRL Y-17804]